MSGNNFIVFMSDEHTPSVLGAYGNPIVKTPNLDRLAAGGIRFDNAYTPSPICISARASFATGTHVFEHACWSSAEPYYGQHQSWMHRLRDRGHEVVSIGKLHYRSAEDDHGFSEEILPMYLANNGMGWPQGLQRKPMAEFPQAAELAAGVGPGETSYTQYDRNITAAAVEWLKRRNPNEVRPWVLFVSLICPHYPLSAPQAFYDLYHDIELPEPFDREATKQLKHPVIDEMRQFWNYAEYFDAEGEREGLRNYYALCSYVDDNVGQIMRALQASGQAGRTQVIYTSDHGDLIGNHGMWCKSFMYEDSAGIPMIYSGPGIETSVNPTPVSLIDIGATVERALTGEKMPETELWRARALQDLIETPDFERPVLSEYHDGGSPCGFYMLRQGSWKYVHYSEGHPPLLFCLDQDPGELNNLAESDVGKLNTMREQLYQILDPEAVNRQALDDQAAMIEKLGGLDAIQSMRSFNHTPIE